MKLIFASDEEDDILNAIIRNSETDSVIYTIETPKHSGGTLTTTIRSQNQVYSSRRFLFKILWKESLEDATVVSDFRTLKEVPVREVLKSAPGGTT